MSKRNKIKQCFVDRGYCGHGIKDVQVFLSEQKPELNISIKKAFKRRSAIVPEIGHMKNDGRLNRHYLKGEMDDTWAFPVQEAQLQSCFN